MYLILFRHTHMETQRPSAEAEKPDAEKKAALEKAIFDCLPELSDWINTTDAQEKKVKDQVKAALGLPATEQILISSVGSLLDSRAPGAEAARDISIVSNANPLKVYATVSISARPRGGQRYETKINPGSEASPMLSSMVSQALKCPEKMTKTTLKSIRTGDVTVHELRYYDATPSIALGTVEVDEKTHRITKVNRNEKGMKEAEDAEAKNAPRTLDQCMVTLGAERRVRNANDRKTISNAIKKEMNLPAAFANRELLLFSDTDARKNLIITVEDKQTETVIGKIEYNTGFKMFSSKTVDSKAIDRALRQ